MKYPTTREGWQRFFARSGSEGGKANTQAQRDARSQNVRKAIEARKAKAAAKKQSQQASK